MSDSVEVTIRLFAFFRDGRFKVETRQYTAGTKIDQVIDELGIRQDEVGVILVNSQHVEPEHVLVSGDDCSLFPLVGGG